MKFFIKLILLLIATSHGNAAIEKPNHAVILLYHHIANDTPAITSISPALFEQQLTFLEQNEFQVWPLPEVLTRIKSGKKLPDKVVVITFDDNYISVYEEAFPRLKKRGWPFTIFVSTNAVDQGFHLQASWEQIREMAEHGATIANHSSSHNHLLVKSADESDDQWRDRIRKDIEHAQKRIEEETTQSHKIFAYPYGEFNSALEELVAEMGYIGIGQHSGPISERSNWQSLPRFPFAGNYTDIKDFSLKVKTLPFHIFDVIAPENPLSHNNSKPSIEILFNPTQPNILQVQCFGSGQGALQVNKDETPKLIVTPKRDIPVGRSRYNCTSPAGDQRYYWFSKPWIRLDQNEEWILD